MKPYVKLSIRFAIYAVVVTVIILVSVFSYLDSRKYYDYNDNSWDNVIPYKILEEGSPYNIVLDQHSHTLYSDGILTPRQNVLWHIAMGYNAMFITDHNTLDHKEDVDALKEEFKETILVMLGMEWTTNRIHLNFLGLTEWDFDQFPINRKNPSDLEIQSAIAEAHRQGAVVVANHYIWSTGRNKPTRQQLMDWGVDYFEIVNCDCNLNDYYDIEGIAFCEANGLGQITGTDMHYPNFLQVNGNVHGWTLITADEFTEEAVMEQLRLRNTTVLHSEYGLPSLGEYPMKSGYKMAKPFIEIGRYFRGIYTGGGKLDWAVIGIVAFYLVSLFAIIELCGLCYSFIAKKLK